MRCGNGERNVRENSGPHRVVTGLRVVRPTQAVRVMLRDEQPVRIYLRGMRGEVVAASGPWRSSGDWWQEDAWYQDEWDLAIAFPAAQKEGEQKRGEGWHLELYRIYYDALRQGWFLRGEYD
jgi:protein ImuB